MTQRQQTLEGKLSISDKLLVGGVVVLGLAGYAWLYSTFRVQPNIQQNLAPHAIYANVGPRGGELPIVGINRDVNGDGRFESTLRIFNPTTGNFEEMMVENYDGQIKVRKFSVVDGKIVYLPE